MSDVFDKCTAWKDYKIAKATGLYPYFRPIEASHGSTEVDIDGRRVIMVGSNNYLGLAGDPRVKEAALNAIRRFGTTCSGSRLLNGTLTMHEELEAKLAKFLHRPAALAVSTGFQTNTGTTGVTETPVSNPIARNPLCIRSAMSRSRDRRCGSDSMISSAFRAEATEAGVIDAE